jgi:pyruvate dehydrogenase E2 component (dihydrolipoamide acetyltransferase)
MSIEVIMPQMGESVVEGTVTRWLVKQGDRVQEDQPLCEISTDKVDTEIPSPGTGVIAKLIASEGETLPVGAPLALIEAVGAVAATTAGAATPGRARQGGCCGCSISGAPAAAAPNAARRAQRAEAASGGRG